MLAAAAGKLPTMELIAEVMLSTPHAIRRCWLPTERCARRDMPYINFTSTGAQGGPAFVPVEYMGFRDAVELVRDNGACRWSRIRTQPAGPGAYRREAAGARAEDWKFSIVPR